MTADTQSSTEPSIEQQLDRYASRELLRFLTCGSVDDGKSTLIGRLLHDANMIYDDQLAAVRRDTVRHGPTGDEIDFALLMDGLEAEREQGITIDVAYRYFSTAKRKFIIADTPGHEQYTRNMATGASTARAISSSSSASYAGSPMCVVRPSIVRSLTSHGPTCTTAASRRCSSSDDADRCRRPSPRWSCASSATSRASVTST